MKIKIKKEVIVTLVIIICVAVVIYLIDGLAEQLRIPAICGLIAAGLVHWIFPVKGLFKKVLNDLIIICVIIIALSFLKDILTGFAIIIGLVIIVGLFLFYKTLK